MMILRGAHDVHFSLNYLNLLKVVLCWQVMALRRVERDVADLWFAVWRNRHLLRGVVNWRVCWALLIKQAWLVPRIIQIIKLLLHSCLFETIRLFISSNNKLLLVSLFDHVLIHLLLRLIHEYFIIDVWRSIVGVLALRDRVLHRRVITWSIVDACLADTQLWLGCLIVPLRQLYWIMIRETWVLNGRVIIVNIISCLCFIIGLASHIRLAVVTAFIRG